MNPGQISEVRPYRTAVAKLEAGTIGCAPAMTFALAGADVVAFCATYLARGRSWVDPRARVKPVAVTTG
jgi:hypothetical protein